MPLGLRRSARLGFVLVAALVSGACGARQAPQGTASTSVPPALSPNDGVAKAIAEGGGNLVRAVYPSLQAEHDVALDRVRCTPIEGVLYRCSMRVTMKTPRPASR